MTFKLIFLYTVQVNQNVMLVKELETICNMKPKPLTYCFEITRSKPNHFIGVMSLKMGVMISQEDIQLELWHIIKVGVKT